MVMKHKAQFLKDKMVINYLIFGIITTLVNWLVYSLLVGVIGTSINIGNMIAWTIAVTFAFFANKVWVFESSSWKFLTVIKEGIFFAGSRLISGALEIVSLPLLITLGINQQLFGIDGFVAKILISVVVVILNYIFSRWLVFRKTMKEEAR